MSLSKQLSFIVMSSMSWLITVVSPPLVVAQMINTAKHHRLMTVNESIKKGQAVMWVPQYQKAVDSSTDDTSGQALQKILIDAYFWGQAHDNSRVTVAVASDSVTQGTRILVPGNVDLICAGYSEDTYSGGCGTHQTDRGDNSATGGSPLFMFDFSIGVLADHKTWCSLFDKPQQPGCIIINSAGGTMSGIAMYGVGQSAGGADIGIRVAANNVHVQDTEITGFFGGPGIQYIGGQNDSFDWNYGTNVNEWWCGNPTEFTPANLGNALSIWDGILGAIELPMIDGEASNNQYSDGCAFSKNFTVSLQYPQMAAMHIGGSTNLVHDNLLQAAGIGLLVDGQQHQVYANKSNYNARDGIFNVSENSTFSDNYVVSGCLDPNLANLRPGAADGGTPAYPKVPTVLNPGFIIKDTNGNVEQILSGSQAGGSGTTDANAPDWPDKLGETVSTVELVWQNMGPWTVGFNAGTDPGAVPAFTSGVCFGVTDIGQNNIWTGTQVGANAGINGASYWRGSYFIAFPGALYANTCAEDQPDAYGNGQCWWGGDLFDNGGPPNLAPNGKTISASGGGTAWVGDYSVVKLTDSTPQQYNNFQGMASGQFFWVTSSTVTNMIVPWAVNGNGSFYGHPSLMTCNNMPLSVPKGMFFEFNYNLSNEFAVTQVDCGASSSNQSPSTSVLVSPSDLTFPLQSIGTTSTAQDVTLTNSGIILLTLSITASGDYAQTNNCGNALAVGSSCTISATFTPTVADIRLGAVSITDNVIDSPQAVTLRGEGSTPANLQAPSMIVTSTSSSLNIDAVGASTTASLLLTPGGSFNGQVEWTCSVAYLGSGQSLDTPTCAVNPGQSEVALSTVSTSTLTVLTTPSTAFAYRELLDPGGPSLATIFFIAIRPRRRKRMGRCLAFLSYLVLVGTAGCGLSTNNVSGTTAGAYQVTVSASSGVLANSLQLQLSIK